jgi:hypothetical protein
VDRAARSPQSAGKKEFSLIDPIMRESATAVAALLSVTPFLIAPCSFAHRQPRIAFFTPDFARQHGFFALAGGSDGERGATLAESIPGSV